MKETFHASWTKQRANLVIFPTHPLQLSVAEIEEGFSVIYLSTGQPEKVEQVDGAAGAQNR